MERLNRQETREKILLHKWASEDPLKAQELSLVDGMHIYSADRLCEHYRNTSLSNEKLLNYLESKHEH